MSQDSSSTLPVERPAASAPGLRTDILQLLQKRRELSRSEIATELGKSIPAVTAHIRALETDGFVADSGQGGWTGGRRSVMVQFRPNARTLVAADIRPGSVRAVLTDLDTTIIRERTRSLPGRPSERTFIDTIGACCREVMSELPTGCGPIVGAGLSLPGTVHSETLEMVFAPNLGLRNVQCTALERKLQLPLWIDNEANVAALAEHQFGGHGSSRHVVYVSVIEGIGVGVVIDGTIYRGARGAAGEFGHMTIVENGRQCSCGRRGCWERYASVDVLISEYHLLGGSAAVSTVDDVAEALSRGDANASAAVERILDSLAIGIENLAVGLDPDRIVVGGAITGSTGSMRLIVEQGLRSRVPRYDIIASTLGDDAAIRGAALLPRSVLIPARTKSL